jgi:hypothetical protein
VSSKKKLIYALHIRLCEGPRKEKTIIGVRVSGNPTIGKIKNFESQKKIFLDCSRCCFFVISARSEIEN